MYTWMFDDCQKLPTCVLLLLWAFWWQRFSFPENIHVLCKRWNPLQQICRGYFNFCFVILFFFSFFFLKTEQHFIWLFLKCREFEMPHSHQGVTLNFLCPLCGLAAQEVFTWKQVCSLWLKQLFHLFTTAAKQSSSSISCFQMGKWLELISLAFVFSI